MIIYHDFIVLFLPLLDRWLFLFTFYVLGGVLRF